MHQQLCIQYVGIPVCCFIVQPTLLPTGTVKDDNNEVTIILVIIIPLMFVIILIFVIIGLLRLVNYNNLTKHYIL